MSSEVTTSQSPVQSLPPASPTSQAETAKVTYRQFEDFLVKEKGKGESCATLPFTTCFWLTFCILAWLHGDVLNIYETRRCLSGVAEDIRVVAGAGTPTARNVSLGLLASKDDIWEWLALGLVPALGGSAPDGSAGVVRMYNQLVGNIRLTQRRSSSMECKVDPGLKKFYGDTKCFSDEVSTETFGVDVAGDLAFKAGSGMTNADENAFYAWMDPRI